MNDIDFLPADYVCQQTTRSNDNWLRGVFVAVLGLMAIGWYAQQRSIADLTSRRDRLRQQAESLVSQTDRGDLLRVELKQLEDSTRLLNGLRTQVPPTRWLTAIVNSLPEKACFTEIHSEVDDGVDTTARPDQNAAKSNPTPKTDPIREDLARLAKITPQRNLSIMLRGTATDDLEVSTLLTALHKLQLFDRVQLLFTDQQSAGNQNLRSFAIRLRTRPLANRTSLRPSSSPVASGAWRDQN